MVDFHRVANFSADKQRFFSSPLRALPEIRNMVRHKYAIQLSEPALQIQPNVLYIEVHLNGLQYTFLDDSGVQRIDQINLASLDSPTLNLPLTSAQLRPLAADILKTFDDREQSGFKFLSKHHLLIDQEFQTIDAVLQRSEKNDRERLLYAYYCCFMLESYYSEDAYSVPTKAKKYHTLRMALEDRLNNCLTPPVVMASLGKKINDAINAALNTVFHTTDLRGWLSFFNMYRILFVFGRLSVRQSLILAQNLHWLDVFAHLIGRQVDVNTMLQIINAPVGIFNALSVQIFAIRFLIIIGEGLKHVLAPTEKEKSLSWTTRLKQELFERHCDILNDIVWGVVNLFSNYPELFKISQPVANWLSAGFLFFDVLLLVYRHYLASEDYKAKKYQFNQELVLLNNENASLERIRLHREQINQLDMDWQATSAYLLFNIAAAALLMAGYSAALLMTAPGHVIVSFVVCTLAVAMYLSAGVYKNYKEKSILLTQMVIVRPSSRGACDEGSPDEALPLDNERSLSTLGITGEQLPQMLDNSNLELVGNIELERARQTEQEAYYLLIKTLVKNTFLPMVIVSLFAISLPAALLFTTMYIVHESFSGEKPRAPVGIWQRDDQLIETNEDLPCLQVAVA